MDNEQASFLSWEDSYIEPKQEEKYALILKLQSGEYSLSYSSLSAFSVSPRNFIAYKLQEYKTTKAMTMGEAVHCKVLEPDMFADRYYIAPNVDGSTVAGKKIWADIYTKFTGIELGLNKQGNPVTPKIDDIIAAVKDATTERGEDGNVIKNGIIILPGASNEEADYRARMLINNRATRYVLNQLTQTESKIEFEFEGIKFKGRLDGAGDGIIADIKNMPDATIHAATRTINARKMYWQAFCYDTATGTGNDCYILAVDGKGETSAHLFSKEHHKRAEIEMREYCQRFKELIEESFFDASVWDQSQDYWLRSENNPHGINFLQTRT
jgi:PDDEXK-like domain of unknown function (DUF3799)